MSNPNQDYLAPYRVACCLYTAVGQALEDAGLHIPERGGITHKLDGDWECEDCESLWVWWEDSEADGDGEFGPKCFVRQERVFTVLLAWNVCTERLDPCTHDPDESYDKCVPCDGDDCVECPEPPVPMIGQGGKCVDNDGLTVASETAWIWAARYAIERRVPYLLGCCLRDCACLPIGCKTVGFNFVSSEVSGGCSFTTFQVRLKW